MKCRDTEQSEEEQNGGHRTLDTQTETIFVSREELFMQTRHELIDTQIKQNDTDDIDRGNVPRRMKYNLDYLLLSMVV